MRVVTVFLECVCVFASVVISLGTETKMGELNAQVIHQTEDGQGDLDEQDDADDLEPMFYLSSTKDPEHAYASSGNSTVPKILVPANVHLYTHSIPNDDSHSACASSVSADTLTSWDRNADDAMTSLKPAGGGDGKDATGDFRSGASQEPRGIMRWWKNGFKKRTPCHTSGTHSHLRSSAGVLSSKKPHLSSAAPSAATAGPASVVLAPLRSLSTPALLPSSQHDTAVPQGTPVVLHRTAGHIREAAAPSAPSANIPDWHWRLARASTAPDNWSVETRLLPDEEMIASTRVAEWQRTRRTAETGLRKLSDDADGDPVDWGRGRGVGGGRLEAPRQVHHYRCQQQPNGRMVCDDDGSETPEGASINDPSQLRPRSHSPRHRHPAEGGRRRCCRLRSGRHAVIVGPKVEAVPEIATETAFSAAPVYSVENTNQPLETPSPPPAAVVVVQSAAKRFAKFLGMDGWESIPSLSLTNDHSIVESLVNTQRNTASASESIHPVVPKVEKGSEIDEVMSLWQSGSCCSENEDEFSTVTKSDIPISRKLSKYSTENVFEKSFESEMPMISKLMNNGNNTIASFANMAPNLKSTLEPKMHIKQQQKYIDLLDTSQTDADTKDDTQEEESTSPFLRSTTSSAALSAEATTGSQEENIFCSTEGSIEGQLSKETTANEKFSPYLMAIWATNRFGTSMTRLEEKQIFTSNNGIDGSLNTVTARLGRKTQVPKSLKMNSGSKRIFNGFATSLFSTNNRRKHFKTRQQGIYSSGSLTTIEKRNTGDGEEKTEDSDKILTTEQFEQKRKHKFNSKSAFLRDKKSTKQENVENFEITTQPTSESCMSIFTLNDVLEKETWVLNIADTKSSPILQSNKGILENSEIVVDATTTKAEEDDMNPLEFEKTREDYRNNISLETTSMSSVHSFNSSKLEEASQTFPSVPVVVTGDKYESLNATYKTSTIMLPKGTFDTEISNDNSMKKSTISYITNKNLGKISEFSHNNIFESREEISEHDIQDMSSSHLLPAEETAAETNTVTELLEAYTFQGDVTRHSNSPTLTTIKDKHSSNDVALNKSRSSREPANKKMSRMQTRKSKTTKSRFQDLVSKVSKRGKHKFSSTAIYNGSELNSQHSSVIKNRKIAKHSNIIQVPSTLPMTKNYSFSEEENSLRGGDTSPLKEFAKMEKHKTVKHVLNSRGEKTVQNSETEALFSTEMPRVSEADFKDGSVDAVNLRTESESQDTRSFVELKSSPLSDGDKPTSHPSSMAKTPMWVVEVDDRLEIKEHSAFTHRAARKSRQVLAQDFTQLKEFRHVIGGGVTKEDNRNFNRAHRGSSSVNTYSSPVHQQTDSVEGRKVATQKVRHLPRRPITNAKKGGRKVNHCMPPKAAKLFGVQYYATSNPAFRRCLGQSHTQWAARPWIATTHDPNFLVESSSETVKNVYLTGNEKSKVYDNLQGSMIDTGREPIKGNWGVEYTPKKANKEIHLVNILPATNINNAEIGRLTLDPEEAEAMAFDLTSSKADLVLPESAEKHSTHNVIWTLTEPVTNIEVRTNKFGEEKRHMANRLGDNRLSHNRDMSRKGQPLEFQEYVSLVNVAFPSRTRGPPHTSAWSSYNERSENNLPIEEQKFHPAAIYYTKINRVELRDQEDKLLDELARRLPTKSGISVSDEERSDDDVQSKKFPTKEEVSETTPSDNQFADSKDGTSKLNIYLIKTTLNPNLAGVGEPVQYHLQQKHHFHKAALLDGTLKEDYTPGKMEDKQTATSATSKSDRDHTFKMDENSQRLEENKSRFFPKALVVIGYSDKNSVTDEGKTLKGSMPTKNEERGKLSTDDATDNYSTTKSLCHTETKSSVLSSKSSAVGSKGDSSAISSTKCSKVIATRSVNSTAKVTQDKYNNIITSLTTSMPALLNSATNSTCSTASMCARTRSRSSANAFSVSDSAIVPKSSRIIVLGVTPNNKIAANNNNMEITLMRNRESNSVSSVKELRKYNHHSSEPSRQNSGAFKENMRIRTSSFPSEEKGLEHFSKISSKFTPEIASSLSDENDFNLKHSEVTKIDDTERSGGRGRILIEIRGLRNEEVPKINDHLDTSRICGCPHCKIDGRSNKGDDKLRRLQKQNMNHAEHMTRTSVDSSVKLKSLYKTWVTKKSVPETQDGNRRMLIQQKDFDDTAFGDKGVDADCRSDGEEGAVAGAVARPRTRAMAVADHYDVASVRKDYANLAMASHDAQEAGKRKQGNHALFNDLKLRWRHNLQVNHSPKPGRSSERPVQSPANSRHYARTLGTGESEDSVAAAGHLFDNNKEASGKKTPEDDSKPSTVSSLSSPASPSSAVATSSEVNGSSKTVDEMTSISTAESSSPISDTGTAVTIATSAATSSLVDVSESTSSNPSVMSEVTTEYSTTISSTAGAVSALQTTYSTLSPTRRISAENTSHTSLPFALTRELLAPIFRALQMMTDLQNPSTISNTQIRNTYAPLSSASQRLDLPQSTTKMVGSNTEINTLQTANIERSQTKQTAQLNMGISGTRIRHVSENPDPPLVSTSTFFQKMQSLPKFESSLMMPGTQVTVGLAKAASFLTFIPNIDVRETTLHVGNEVATEGSNVSQNNLQTSDTAESNGEVSSSQLSSQNVPVSESVQITRNISTDQATVDASNLIGILKPQSTQHTKDSLKTQTTEVPAEHGPMDSSYYTATTMLERKMIGPHSTQIHGIGRQLEESGLAAFVFSHTANDLTLLRRKSTQQLSSQKLRYSSTSNAATSFYPSTAELTMHNVPTSVAGSDTKMTTKEFVVKLIATPVTLSETEMALEKEEKRTPMTRGNTLIPVPKIENKDVGEIATVVNSHTTPIVNKGKYTIKTAQSRTTNQPSVVATNMNNLVNRYKVHGSYTAWKMNNICNKCAETQKKTTRNPCTTKCTRMRTPLKSPPCTTTSRTNTCRTSCATTTRPCGISTTKYTRATKCSKPTTCKIPMRTSCATTTRPCGISTTNCMRTTKCSKPTAASCTTCKNPMRSYATLARGYTRTTKCTRRTTPLKCPTPTTTPSTTRKHFTTCSGPTRRRGWP